MCYANSYNNNNNNITFYNMYSTVNSNKICNYSKLNDMII